MLVNEANATISLDSNVVDLTLSESDTERSSSNSSKRKIIVPTESPPPPKKFKVALSRPFRQPPSSSKDVIAERDTRQRDARGQSQSPPSRSLLNNVLVLPQIQITSTTAKGFSTSYNVLPAVKLDQRKIRRLVRRNLSALDGPSVKLINDIDDSSLPVQFKFINDHVLGEGVVRSPDEFMAGCQCRPDNGRHIGCEHLSCQCVQLSDPDGVTGKRHFPYSAHETNYGCLRSVYLKTRRHIYECNDKCNCAKNCKNRVVQHGRQVPLEIFKTTNRGWGESSASFFHLNWMLNRARSALSSRSPERFVHRYVSR